MVREKIASVGTPLVGGDSKIIDDAGRVLPRGEIGEIVGYSTGFMRGYHQLPQETADAIWRDALGRTYLRTGDVGRLDEDGYLYILDRKKDMIISGGVNVFPRDIEEVLLTHPQVADAAVIGIHVAKYQRLTDVTFRDALPRNALGKVLKKELRAPYWNPLKQDV